MSRSRGSRWVMSRSPRRIVPSSTVSRPAIIRSKVVLPQPDGPTSTMSSPSSIVRLISSTALTPPANVLLTPLKTISLTRTPQRSVAEIRERRRQVQIARGAAHGDLVRPRKDRPVGQFGVPLREGTLAKREAHVLLRAWIERNAPEIPQLPRRTVRALRADVELHDRFPAPAAGIPDAHRGLDLEAAVRTTLPLDQKIFIVEGRVAETVAEAVGRRELIAVVVPVADEQTIPIVPVARYRIVGSRLEDRRVLQARRKRHRQPSARFRSAQQNVRQRVAELLARIPDQQHGRHLLRPVHQHLRARAENDHGGGVRGGDSRDQLQLLCGKLERRPIEPFALERLTETRDHDGHVGVGSSLNGALLQVRRSRRERTQRDET